MAAADSDETILVLTRKIAHLEAENERLTAQLIYARASLFTRVSAGSAGVLRSPGGGSDRPHRPASSPPVRPPVSRIAEAATPAVDLASALAQTPGPGEELCDNWCGIWRRLVSLVFACVPVRASSLVQWQGCPVFVRVNAPPALPPKHRPLPKVWRRLPSKRHGGARGRLGWGARPSLRCSSSRGL